MRSKATLVAAALVAGCGLTMVGPAAAQGRHRRRSVVVAVPAHHRGGVVRSAVIVGPGAWGPWGPWGPFWPPYYPPYPPYPPYPYYAAADDSAHLKTDVEPKEARVYVDGYYAGIVDDFDGIFQSLRLEPGAHDVTLYLHGYRTLTQRLYLGPDSTFKLSVRLEPLRPGEVSEEPPAPRQRPVPVTPGRPAVPPPPPSAAPPPVPPAPAEPPPAGTPEAPAMPSTPPAPAEPGAEAEGFGAVAIRVQPADAEISIDGQPWTDGAGEQPLVVQLAAGAHTIDIRKPGYRSFSIHVDVQDGETTPINVRLPRGQ